jgi:hypothetical protein
VDRMHLVQDRGQWRAAVNTAMEPSGSLKAVSLSASSITVN